MNLSERAISKLKALEGFEAHIYFDGDEDEPAIGYGHRLTRDDTMSTVTREEADALLRADCAYAEQGINDYVHVPLTQGQFDALCLFVYNVGLHAFAHSTLLRALDAGDYAGVPAQLERWTNANGHRLAGLVRRRTAEIALWKGETDAT